MNQEIHRTKKQKEKVGRSLPKIQEGLSLTKLLKNNGCGSKQVVQDLNEAEDWRIKRRRTPSSNNNQSTSLIKKSRSKSVWWSFNPRWIGFWSERWTIDWKRATRRKWTRRRKKEEVKRMCILTKYTRCLSKSVHRQNKMTPCHNHCDSNKFGFLKLTN